MEFFENYLAEGCMIFVCLKMVLKKIDSKKLTYLSAIHINKCSFA